MSLRDSLKTFLKLPQGAWILYLIRDHYYRYRTTMFLFAPATQADLAILGKDEYLAKVPAFISSCKNIQSVSNAPYYIPQLSADFSTPVSDYRFHPSIVNAKMPPYRITPTSSVNPLWSQDNIDTMSFLWITTAGHLKEIPNATVNSPMIGLAEDKAPIMARLEAISANPVYPNWFKNINGTSVVSFDTVPSSKQVMDILDSVLYEYYTSLPIGQGKNLWIKATIPSSRFRTYLSMFTSGNITLDYFKKIQVQDRILSTDKGKDLTLFPSFLVLDGDLSVDPYDPLYLRVNSPDIRQGIADVINYIENQLFAQDIALLNKINDRFTNAVNANSAAISRLDQEKAKLDKADKDLQATLLEAKKIYTAYEQTMTVFGKSVDPVISIMNSLDDKIKAELTKFEASETQRLTLEAQEKKAAEVKAKLAAIEAQRQADLAQQAAEAVAAKIAEAEKAKAQIAASQSMQENNKVINYKEQPIAPIVGPIETKSMVQEAVKEEVTIAPSEALANPQKTSALPLVAGLGILAALGLGVNK